MLCAEPQHGQSTPRKPGSRTSTVSGTWDFGSKEHLQSHTCQLPLRPTACPGSFILNTCFPSESLESGAENAYATSTQSESWAWSPQRASHDVIRREIQCPVSLEQGLLEACLALPFALYLFHDNLSCKHDYIPSTKPQEITEHRNTQTPRTHYSCVTLNKTCNCKTPFQDI